MKSAAAESRSLRAPGGTEYLTVLEVCYERISVELFREPPEDEASATSWVAVTLPALGAKRERRLDLILNLAHLNLAPPTDGDRLGTAPIDNSAISLDQERRRILEIGAGPASEVALKSLP